MKTKKTRTKRYELIKFLDKVGGNRRTLSVLLGISYIAATKKVAGLNDFTASEIARIKDHYGLTPEQVETIFLTEGQ